MEPVTPEKANYIIKHYLGLLTEPEIISSAQIHCAVPLFLCINLRNKGGSPAGRSLKLRPIIFKAFSFTKPA